MSFLFPPLTAFYSAAQAGLRPLRKAGAMGLPDTPLYFRKGDALPWWIECRWPIHLACTFGTDVETYFEDGAQVVRPLENTGDALLIVENKKARRCEVLLVGAPTHLDSTPRSRRRPAPKLKLVIA